jgi:hypothetical protein
VVSCTRCKGSGKVPSAEEYAIHDHEGFDGYSVSEFEDLNALAELVRLIEKHGSVYGAHVGQVGTDYASENDFEEKYQGVHDSLEAYAERWAEDTGMLSDARKSTEYFDFEEIRPRYGVERRRVHDRTRWQNARFSKSLMSSRAPQQDAYTYCHQRSTRRFAPVSTPTVAATRDGPSHAQLQALLLCAVVPLKSLRHCRAQGDC